MSELRHAFTDAFKEALPSSIGAAFKEAWPLDLEAFNEGFPAQALKDAFKEGIAFFFWPVKVWNTMKDVYRAFGNFASGSAATQDKADNSFTITISIGKFHGTALGYGVVLGGATLSVLIVFLLLFTQPPPSAIFDLAAELFSLRFIQ
jgi:hypothetical protein